MVRRKRVQMDSGHSDWSILFFSPFLMKKPHQLIPRFGLKFYRLLGLHEQAQQVRAIGSFSSKYYINIIFDRWDSAFLVHREFRKSDVRFLDLKIATKTQVSENDRLRNQNENISVCFRYWRGNELPALKLRKWIILMNLCLSADLEVENRTSDYGIF